jgi:hypothetical protein
VEQASTLGGTTAVLKASQVEVGISRKETESNAGSIGTLQTDSESEGESETGVVYGIKRIRSNGSDQQGVMTEERTHKLNLINITI